MPNSIDEIYIVCFINDTIGTHGQKMRGTRFENYFDRFLFLAMNK